MPYEQEWSLLKLLLERAGTGWDALSSRVPKLPGKWIWLLAGTGLVLCALFLRYFHLLNYDHYYILSADSYFFHWLAGKVMAGEELPAGVPPGAVTGILHSGLAYPLAYIAKAIGYVFGLSPTDALNVACKLLSPLLSVVSMGVIYLAATKIFNRQVGLYTALAWAIMAMAILIGAAGYLDRDGLSLLLVMLGALLFYLSKNWRFRIVNKDIGWLLAGLGILAIEGLLYLEWSFVGAIILLAIIIAYFVPRLFMAYFDRIQTERNLRNRVAGALSEVNWKVFAIIVLGHAVFTAINANQVSTWFTFATAIVRYSSNTIIAEMAGIGLVDLGTYSFLLIPMLLGLYLAWRRRNEGAIFFSLWFLVLFVLSLFAKRVLIYATPAACLLSGVGLAFLAGWMKQGQLQVVKKVGVGVLLSLLVLFSLSAYSLGSNPRVAVNEEWQDALTYLRDSTPQDSVVMTWWDYGYWILDLGQRRPVVDNGYYGWDQVRLHDIAVVYTTTDPSEAVQIMEKYGANYLVFSTLETDIALQIVKLAGKDEQYKGFENFPRDSMIIRTLNGEFESGSGLEVVHHTAPDSEVFILRLTQPQHSQ